MKLRMDKTTLEGIASDWETRKCVQQKEHIDGGPSLYLTFILAGLAPCPCRHSGFSMAGYENENESQTTAQKMGQDGVSPPYYYSKLFISATLSPRSRSLETSCFLPDTQDVLSSINCSSISKGSRLLQPGVAEPNKRELQVRRRFSRVSPLFPSFFSLWKSCEGQRSVPHDDRPKWNPRTKQQDVVSFELILSEFLVPCRVIHPIHSYCGCSSLRLTIQLAITYRCFLSLPEHAAIEMPHYGLVECMFGP